MNSRTSRIKHSARQYIKHSARQYIKHSARQYIITILLQEVNCQITSAAN